MRVLLITDWMSGHGGVEAHITSLRDGLRAAGDDARLLTSSAGRPAQASPDYVAYGTERRAGQALLQIANPFAAMCVRRAMREFSPDVVQVHMFANHLSPAIFSPLRSVPTVLYVNDYKPVCPTSWKLLPDGSICTDPAGFVCWRNGCTSFPHWLRDRPRYGLLRAELEHVDRVLACSRSVQRELAVKGISSQVVYLPVAAGFRADRPRAPGAEPVFVYCGRLSEEKGVELLLRAFARLRQSVPAARLRLLGTGPQRQYLERLVHELGLGQAVLFRGWVPPECVKRELVGAWALVAPSLHAEPLGLVALEALVGGVPVIASDTGGFAETVEDGVTGLLFPNGDEAALVRHLEAVAERRRFPGQGTPADAVRRVAETHDLERHVGLLREIHAELVSDGRGEA